MRPSELRREERRAWFLFVVLCLGCVGAIWLADIVAGTLVSDRHVPPDPNAAAGVPVVAYPQRVVAEMAGAIVQTSERLQQLLEAERQAEIAGSILFHKGTLSVAHMVADTPDGKRLVAALLTPPASAARDPKAERSGRLTIVVFEDRAGTWQPIGAPLFSRDYAPAAAAALSAAGVAIRDAGAAVFAIELPDEQRCLPVTRSDRALTRTLYVTLDGSPAIALSHISSGVRGNDPSDLATLELRWKQRDQQLGRGLLVVTERRGDLLSAWETPFRYRDRTFELVDTPATLFDAEERIAVASAREGREGAQALLENQLRVLQLVAPLEGPLNYCLGFPHRVARPQELDARRWQDNLADRLFRVRLPLAELLAQQGQLRAAVQVVGLKEPALALSSSAQGRRILDSMTSARVLGLDTEQVELRRRVTFAEHPRFTPLMPMLWTPAGELLVPEPPPYALPPALLPALRAGATAAVAEFARAHYLDVFSAAAPNLWQGAVHGVARLLTQEDPRSAGSAVAAATRRRASTVVGALAEREQRYTGELFRKLDVATGAWSAATWDDMQVYQPFTAPIDLSPSLSRLLVDFGQTCDGGFLELCVGFPERCRTLPASAPAGGSAPAEGLSTKAAVVWPGLEMAACFPGELPQPERAGIEFLGWPSDNLALFAREGATLAVEVAITGEATAALVPGDEALARFGGTPRFSWPLNALGYAVVLDDYGIWLVDTRSGRELLLEWWERVPIGPPAGLWQATLSPDGRYLALWLEGEGLWTASVSRLDPR